MINYNNEENHLWSSRNVFEDFYDINNFKESVSFSQNEEFFDIFPFFNENIDKHLFKQNNNLNLIEEKKTEKDLFNNISITFPEFPNKKSNCSKELNTLNNISQSTTKKTKKSKKGMQKNKCENEKPKDRQDNKIIKIKTYLINEYHKYINSLLEKKGKKLCKINTTIKEKIKKDFNINLINKTFKNIYLTNDICVKYKNEKWKTNNSKVINYIYNCEEDETIKIIKKLLNLTFGDIILIFLRKTSTIEQKLEDLNIENFPNMKKFHEYLKVKKKKDYAYIDNYIKGGNGEKGVKDLCLEIDEWFNQKIGRKENKI